MKLIFSFLIFFVLVISKISFSQSVAIEKAKQKIYASKTDEERLTNLVAIGKLRNSLHGDTIYYYALWAKKLAIKLNDSKSLAWAAYSLISGDLAKGQTDSIIEKIESNGTFTEIKKTDASLYFKIQLLKANALNRLNRRPEALDLQLKILSEAEKEGNTNTQLFALNFIGATYLNVFKNTEARDTWLKALQIIGEKNNAENNEIEAYILSNLAQYHFNNYYVNRSKTSNDSFFNYINKTIDLSKQNENLGVFASALSLRGNFYGITQQFADGEKDIKEGLEVRKKIGDPFYIVNDFTGLSSFYLSQKQYKKCVEAAQEGITIADNYGIKGEQLTLFGIIAMAYKLQGNYEQYSKTLEKIITVADSSNRMNAADKIAAIQTKYEVQKKETLIAKQQLDLFRRKLFIYGGAITTALLLILLAYWFKRYKQQQKIKLVAILNKEKQQSNIALKDAEEKQRKRIAAELHDNLGVQANAILHNSSLLNETNANNKIVVAGLQETAKEMLHNLRETLWAMKTADVSATDLWLRIINFIKQMGRHYTNINFKVDGLPPENFTIASSQALHIVLVLQETVNNSVKHAAAKTITATSSNTALGWKITMVDDGKGFVLDATKLKTDSYGLTNMQQRATEGNFKYHIETTIDNGTITTINIPA